MLPPDVTAAAQKKNCEYSYYSMNPIKSIYRQTTNEGYFDSNEIRETGSIQCKKIELNRFMTLHQNIGSSRRGFPTSSTYLNILDSNVPDLTLESFSDMMDQFKAIAIMNSNVSRIDPTFMKAFTNLEEIVLDNNNLDSNQTNNFFECKYLKIVSLSHNKLTTLGNLTNISNLQFLILNNNLITSLDGISKIQNLKQLDLSHNSISNIPTEFQNVNLIVLDLSFNNITIFEDCSNVFQIVKLNNNNLKSFCTFSSTIKEIVYGDNVITYIDENTFKGLAKLEKLDINNNLINKITTNTFKDLSHLLLLNLSNNHIDSLSLGCFKNLKNLISLDLKYNSLTELDSGIFTDLSRLKYLDISANHIYSFDANIIFPLRLLNYLYLEGVTIDERTIEEFPEHFPYLNSVSLTFTSVGCDKLLGIMRNFKSNFITVKKGSTRYRENINGIKCDSSIKNATETIEEIALYNVLKSISRIYAILIVVCIMLMSVVFSFIMKNGYSVSKKYKNVSNTQLL